ncbi:MAG TPA: hypothetical protein VJ279_08575 [Hanamia sp.]|jgi:hypothetical protein|nr:hypothetical protein [Hanamia sp.]
MGEWINCNIAKPPESHSVLLYVVCFHEDKKNIWDENIYVGFYGDDDYEKIGFYLETINSDMTTSYTFIEEHDQLKVMAWTLLPRKPYKSLFDEEWTA